MTGQVRFAIVGAGNISRHRHVPAMLASKQIQLLGVVDPHVDRRSAVAAQFHLAHHSPDLSAAWLDDVEAVTVAVPPKAHALVVREALRLGKDVLLEKPMTLTLQEAEELVALAEDRGRILAVVHNFQFATSSRRLKKMIGDGGLGELTGIFCFQSSTRDRRLPSWAETLPLGLYYDESPHLLYLLRAFGGDVEVGSVVTSPPREDRTTPSLITVHARAGTLPAVMYHNFDAPVSEWHFAVYGTRGVGIVDLFRDLLVVLPYDGKHLAIDIARTSLRGTADHVMGFFVSAARLARGKLFYGVDEVLRLFVRAVRTRMPPPQISSADGLAVLRLQHAILENASRQGGWRH